MPVIAVSARPMDWSVATIQAMPMFLPLAHGILVDTLMQFGVLQAQEVDLVLALAITAVTTVWVSAPIICTIAVALEVRTLHSFFILYLKPLNVSLFLVHSDTNSQDRLFLHMCDEALWL